MIDLTLNKRSFSDRLLYPEGISRLNRARRELFSFEPVGDTCQVTLSDLDGEVSRFLNIDVDRQLQEGIYTLDRDVRVEVASDGDPLIQGYIAPGSFGRVHLNSDDLDAQDIFRFSVIDDTIHLFNWLATVPVGRLTGSRDHPIEVFRAIIPLGVAGGTILYELPVARLSSLIGGLTGRACRVSPIYENLFINLMAVQRLAELDRGKLTRSFGVMRGPSRLPEERSERPISCGEVLIDLATFFLANMRVGEDGALEFMAANAELDRPTVRIQSAGLFETPENEGLQVDYVEDRRFKINPDYGTGDVMETVYYRFDGQGNFGETALEPTYGQSAVITPILASVIEWADYRDFVIVPSTTSGTGWDRHYWYHSAEKKQLIRDFLLPRAPFRLNTVGVKFFVGQRVSYDGHFGFVIREANIEPMVEEAELFLEYRPAPYVEPEEPIGPKPPKRPPKEP